MPAKNFVRIDEGKPTPNQLTTKRKNIAYHSLLRLNSSEITNPAFFMRINILKTHLSNALFLIAVLTLLALASGCTSTWQQPPPDNQVSGQNDPLSYGAVTSSVKKGETTQEEIIRLFGAPNITTVNANGEEVWVYDRISDASQQNGWSEARRFNSFFGLDTYSAKASTSHVSSTRTLTVIVNFDLTKKVKDYSARATQF